MTVKQLATQEKKLANGATLLFTPIETAPRLAISMFLQGGNTLDPIPGLSDMTDRMLLKGTETRSQEDISIEIDGLTLELDSDTKRDYTGLHATMLEEDLDASFDLITDIFHNASFAEFEREKQKVAGEVAMDLDSPKSRASDQFIRKMFENTPYGTVGSVINENLPNMTTDQVKAHYKGVFNPQHLVVSVAGNIALDRITEVIEKAFPANAGDVAQPDAAAVARLQEMTIEDDVLVTFPRDDSSQCHIYKGWLMPPSRHEDYYPLAVLNTILGAAGLSSRLFLELRDKQGLAYNVRSTYEAYRHRGLFYLYIGTEPKNKDKCLKGFIQEIDKLVQTPVGDVELADAKRNILGRRSVFLETAHQQANYIGANYTMGRTLKDIEQIVDKMEAVTAADIQRVAQKYLTRPAVVSIVAPSSAF